MAMVLPRLGAATLWKTEAQLTTQYGETVEIRRDRDDRTFTFQANDLRIEVKFFDGISQNITYQHSDDTKPLTSGEVESLLEDNSGDKRWLQKDEQTWELGRPAVATASLYILELTR
jgi:hypothetical protein